MTTTSIDKDRIAAGLRASRGGKVPASGGYFGAIQLLGEVRARFRVPRGGGRATDPSWTARRQVALAPQTLERLEELSAKLSEHGDVKIAPLQLAALVLEKAVEGLTDKDLGKLTGPGGH